MSQCTDAQGEASLQKLLNGVDVLSGDRRGANNLFKDSSAYSIRRASEDEEARTTSATSSFASVNTAVQSEFGVSLSAAIAAKKGIVDISTQATFANTDVMKNARSATAGGERVFSWGLKKYVMSRAFAALSEEVLDASFKALVKALTPESTYNQYGQIFGKYGTHFIREADIGVRVERYTQIDKCYAESEDSTSLESCQKASLNAKFSEEVTDQGGSGGVEVENCNLQESSTGSGSSSSKMTESELSRGGDLQMLACGGWTRYIAEDCLTLGNADVFPTSLEGIWNLFGAAGNNDADVYANAQDYFYEFLKKNGQVIDQADTSAVDCTPKDLVAHQSDASGLFLLAMVWAQI